MRDPHLILGIGELLWDVVAAAEGSAAKASPLRMLGGAPANFTVMVGHLGNHAAILSRIGRDELGRQAVDALDSLPVDTSLLQIDPVHETGRVTVQITQGEPQYTIHEPAAWDFLELSDEWVKLAERADAVCFGTLAQRAPLARQTIQTLVAQTPAASIRILDVNLRAPYYSSEIMQESLELASVVKMNAEEMPFVLNLLGLGANDQPRDHARLSVKILRSGAERLLEEFPELELVAITRGSHGSLLIQREEWHEHPGYPVKAVDAIGAGDAFTAAMAHYLLHDASLATLNEAGNRWGSWIASQPGAMPALSEAVLTEISALIEGKESS